VRTYTLAGTTECIPGGAGNATSTCTELPRTPSPGTLFALWTLNAMEASQLALAFYNVRLRLKRLRYRIAFISNEMFPGTFPLLASVAATNFVLAVIGYSVGFSHFREEISSLSDWKESSGPGWSSAFFNIVLTLLSALVSCGLAYRFSGAPLVGTCCGEIQVPEFHQPAVVMPATRMTATTAQSPAPEVGAPKLPLPAAEPVTRTTATSAPQSPVLREVDWSRLGLPTGKKNAKRGWGAALVGFVGGALAELGDDMGESSWWSSE
jgi:hypothetical protein